jgi:hypothetical protein
MHPQLKLLQYALVFCFGLSVIIGIQLAQQVDITPTTLPTYIPAPTHSTTVADATSIAKTAQALFGIDPLHTPRSIVIVDTPTPSPISTYIVSTSEVTPSPEVTTSPRFFVEDGSLKGLGMIAERICVSLEPHDFWQADDKADQLTFHLIHDTKVVIDGKITFNGDDFFSLSIDTLGLVRDETGQLIGSYGGTVQICFKTDNLEVGLHSATISVKTAPNNIYEYSWEFEIIGR